MMLMMMMMMIMMMITAVELAGEDAEERLGSADESAQVRKAGRHGRSDLPQRSGRPLQSEIAILQRIHLRKSPPASRFYAMRCCCV